MKTLRMAIRFIWCVAGRGEPALLCVAKSRRAAIMTKIGRQKIEGTSITRI